MLKNEIYDRILHMKEDKKLTVNKIINLAIFYLMFICYTLKFFYPPFYAMSDKFAGMFVFICEGILILNNYNPFKVLLSKDKNDKDQKIELIIIVLLLIITGVNLIIVKSGFGAFFTASNFILIFYGSNKLNFSKYELRIMSLTYFIMLMFWLIVLYPGYFGSYDSTFPLNTNGAATFSIYTFFCAYIILDELFEKYKFMGVVITIMFVRIIRLDIWHRARGAFIIITLFFVFYYLIPKKWWENKKFVPILTCMATLGSIVFVFFYMWLGSTGFNFTLPIFYKNIFSGRELIWLECLSYFIKSPLTGIGTGITLKTFVEFNVHNAMYDILIVHGIVVFIGALYFIFKRFNTFKEYLTKNKTALLAFCILISVFFESFIDVDLLWADYALNLIFLLGVINSYGKECD